MQLAPLVGLPQLARLSLEEGNVTALPPVVAGLPNLRTLLLGSNKITALPQGAGPALRWAGLPSGRLHARCLPAAAAGLSWWACCQHKMLL